MTDQKQARGASDNVWHWRWLRITAVGLVFLCGWFLVMLVAHLVQADADGVKRWLSDPYAAGAMAAMLLLGFVHHHIGIHEILTDYIPGAMKNRVANMLNNVVTLGLLLGSLAAVGTVYLGAS